MKQLFLCLVLAARFAPMLHAERWKVQFFHDEDRSALTITDLAFPTAKTGIACGILNKTDSKPQGVVLVTRDGGAEWKQVPIADYPVSMHFVDESVGFLVGNKAIWKTEERGLTWKKLKSLSGIQQVYFKDANQGYAVGSLKQFLSTSDGGMSWTPVPEGLKPASNPKITSYQWIAFRGEQRGIVFGGATPPRRRVNPVPDWADPEAAQSEREWPSLSISLETRDGGKTWVPQTAPVFGRVVKLRFVAGGLYGMSVVLHEKAFEVPSEVYLFNWTTGKSETIFKEKGKLVTDVAFTGPSSAIAVMIDRPGTFSNSPLPGKLKIMRANNLRAWVDMPVDYRASGTHAMLAVVDEKNAWVALDSGMILRLEP